MDAGIVREGRELWVATTLDSVAGAGISFLADGVGIAFGVGATVVASGTGPAAPFIGVAAGSGMAGVTAWAGGAAWGAMRSDAVDFTVNMLNTVEDVYDRAMARVIKCRGGYCLFYCQ